MEFYLSISVLTIVLLIVAIVRVNDLSRRMDSISKRMTNMVEAVKKNVANMYLVLTEGLLKLSASNFSL